jgi:hypothetical protein
VQILHIPKEKKELFLNDILQVIYAPKKAFKNIITNPKYLGVIVILVLFMGLQLGYEASQFSKVHIETTSPVAGAMQDYNNATYWQSDPNVALTNNFNDYFNNTVFLADYNEYLSLFGNNSMQIQANNTNTFLVALTNTSNVDCTANGFQNLSITMKLVEPQSAPSSATLTLYSLGDANYYTYDLTGTLSSADAINQWGNLTIPLGPDATAWIASGNPTWQNITSLTLQLTYPSSQDITVRIGALFFRGEYVQPLIANASGFLYTFLLQFSLQFLASWLILTGMIFVMFKVLKSTVTWKPIFIAAGFALIVMVIRAAVNVLATFTLPELYYPYDAALGVVYDWFGSLNYPAALTLPVAQSAAAITSINASMATFKAILTGMFIVSYIWLAGLAALIVKELQPEYATMKCLLIAAVSVGVTLLVLFLFIGFV